jgi:hypothetical protein
LQRCGFCTVAEVASDDEIAGLRSELLIFRGEFAQFQITVSTALRAIMDDLTELGSVTEARFDRIDATLNTLVDTLAAHMSDGHGGQAA